MKKVLYSLSLLFSRLSALFSTHRYLHTARLALLHELTPMVTDRVDGTQILIAKGKYHRVFAVKPTQTQEELGNILLRGKTRSGKGLAIETTLFTWPYATIVNDIKGELYDRTAGFRQQGLAGKVFRFDPRGNGNTYDPLEGRDTDSALRSAATTLLYRANEKENAVFTERAITMLTQVFHAARLEAQRPLPFTYKVMNEGLIGAATILEIISQQYHHYPNLATKFLDINYDKADFDSKFLQDCWSTLTARMNQILTKESMRCFMGSDFTAKDIITSEKPISVYLCWPEHDVLALSPLIQLVWESLMSGMTAYYDAAGGAGCSRVLAVLDEIFRTGMPKLPEYATTVCGRNISLLVSAQSKSQMDAAFGRFNAEVLRAQFDTCVSYRPADQETAEDIERSLGYKSGFAHSKTDHEHGTSQGESEQRIPLMPAHEIKLLGDTQVIIQRTGMRPTVGERLNWHEFPELVRRSQLKPPEMTTLTQRSANGVYKSRVPIPLFQLER